MILEEYLISADYDVTTAVNGQIALDKLNETGAHYDVVLLDRMMPVLDGMSVLKIMKQDARLAKIPVIFQTAMVDKNYILEGFKAGAFYYLTKPFTEEELTSVVHDAITDHQHYQHLSTQAEKGLKVFQMMSDANFVFKTIDEGELIATYLSNVFPQFQKMARGLYELIINAVEHGNLEISYAGKSQLLKQGKLHEEIERRLEDEQFRSRRVKLSYHMLGEELRVTIIDEGHGFNWQEYMDINPERMVDSHGRGIALANLFSFDRLEYQGNGNTVTAVVKVPDKDCD